MDEQELQELSGKVKKLIAEKLEVDEAKVSLDDSYLELYETMKKLIAEKLEVDEAKVSLEASFRQELGADSLDTYELVYAIEEKMSISIPDEKANEFETVGDAYAYIYIQIHKL